MDSALFEARAILDQAIQTGGLNRELWTRLLMKVIRLMPTSEPDDLRVTVAARLTTMVTKYGRGAEIAAFRRAVGE